VAGDAGWALLAVLAVVTELVARRRRGVPPPVGHFGALVARRLPGRLLLLTLWCLTGLHLFARATAHA